VLDDRVRAPRVSRVTIDSNAMRALCAPGGGYYTLLASLPHLPRFDRATRLPITRERLDARLAWLRPEDARVVRQAERFLEWQRQRLERTDAQVVDEYAALVAQVRSPALRRMIEFRFGLRVIMSALRRRRGDGGAPAPGERWAPVEWSAHIVRHWHEPDLRLAARCPWLPQARVLLEQGEPLALERLLMGLVWDHLGEVGRGHYFDLEALLVYLFRWEILDRWLRAQPATAAARIDRLVAQALGEHAGLFA
jgi:hypothetical protein